MNHSELPAGRYARYVLFETVEEDGYWKFVVLNLGNGLTKELAKEKILVTAGRKAFGVFGFSSFNDCEYTGDIWEIGR